MQVLEVTDHPVEMSTISPLHTESQAKIQVKCHRLNFLFNWIPVIEGLRWPKVVHQRDAVRVLRLRKRETFDQ